MNVIDIEGQSCAIFLMRDAGNQIWNHFKTIDDLGHFSDSQLYSGVELRPWTFQWDLTLYFLIWTVSHINRSEFCQDHKLLYIRWKPHFDIYYRDCDSLHTFQTDMNIPETLVYESLEVQFSYEVSYESS